MSEHLPLVKVLIKWNSSALVGDFRIYNSVFELCKIMHLYDNVLFNLAMGHHLYNLNKVPQYKDFCIRKMSILTILTKGKKTGNKNECSSIRIWLNKMWSIHSLDSAGFKITEIRSVPVDLYYIVTKKGKIQINVYVSSFSKTMTKPLLYTCVHI